MIFIAYILHKPIELNNLWPPVVLSGAGLFSVLAGSAHRTARRCVHESKCGIAPDLVGTRAHQCQHAAPPDLRSSKISLSESYRLRDSAPIRQGKLR